MLRAGEEPAAVNVLITADEVYELYVDGASCGTRCQQNIVMEKEIG